MEVLLLWIALHVAVIVGGVAINSIATWISRQLERLLPGIW
jgi:hypothetical protein